MPTTTIVIGAGISGLVAARSLAKAGVECQVLEARNRVGGRALSVDVQSGSLDLGPAWIWPGMQPRVNTLVEELGLELLEQFESGDFLFETTGDIKQGPYPTRYADARRIRCGVQGLAQHLQQELPKNSVTFDSKVIGLSFNAAAKLPAEQKIDVQLENGQSHKTDFVINTIPGPLVGKLAISPELPTELLNAQQRWPTWMAAHAKVLLIYERPFWREQGLSGSCISHRGPLFEIADQSDEENGLYALFGFVAWPADQRMAEANKLQEAVYQQISRLFGADSPAPLEYHYKDWASEAFTATAQDTIAPSHHPHYGDPLFEIAYANGRLHLAGAETSRAHGGLIEGAIESGLRAAAAVQQLSVSN